MNGPAIVRDICLIGGGHSHVLLIRQWAMNPLPGVRLSLVSSAIQTPYSGMLPGLIAGHYSVDDVHVDLLRLCAWAGVRFIEDTVVGLDLNLKQIQFTRRPSIEFDALSLDTGSTPDLSVPGSQEFVTPVKPVHNFYARWQLLLNRLHLPSTQSLSIGVVGSGAGGFELVTAMRHALPDSKATFYWFLRDSSPIKGRADKVGQLALTAARRIGIKIIDNFDVEYVRAGQLVAADGREFELDEILWCTAAVGPGWPKAAGLSVDKRGFVATSETLQSVSHPFVFATGDIGTQVPTPSTKAGVFAVRQAPYLFINLRAYILGESFKPYKPQKDFLSLMATGGKSAIASRGPVAFEAKWVWLWKDHIDQQFMRQFTQLPVMSMNPALAVLPDALIDVEELNSVSSMRCRGCGAKVGGDILDTVVESFQTIDRDDVMSDLSTAGDAAVLRLANTDIVQSVDQINAIVDDQYLLGKIAVLHALSDVVTLDAVPHSAQIIVTLPEATPSVVERDLRLLMSGVVEALNEEACTLIGGHTTQGSELSVGLVVNAVMRSVVEGSGDPMDNSFISKPAQAGDVLILTQPLGIGTLFAGLMQQKANGDDIANAVQLMLHSNSQAAGILRRHGAKLMTDVTGFGLLGHLERLCRSLSMGATVTAGHIPLLAGALILAQDQVRSSLWRQNRVVLQRLSIASDLSEAMTALMCDPQTSGGLLSILPADHQQICINELVDAEYKEAAVIGVVNDSQQLSVTL